MKKIFLFFLTFSLFISAKAQEFGNLYSFDKIHNRIELDITKISRIEHRTHILYSICNDARFKISTSKNDGIFMIIPSKRDNITNLKNVFDNFYNEELEVYNSMTKEELGDSYSEWKSELPEEMVASMMMDYYVHNRDNSHCADADPFCTDNGIYEFPAGTSATGAGSAEAGPNYACLTTQPNPAWYYMRIGTPGNINIYMYSTPGEDIDFCCWGPFSDPVEPCPYGLTLEKKVSCSYSGNPTETCIIPATAQTGEYYILVITNYSDNPCNITFSKTGGSGTTDCSIMPPLVGNDGPYCVGETISLRGNAQSGASYSWSGPGGWSATGQNVTRPNCTMAMAGSYTCTISLNGQTSSAETEVTVYANPTANFNATTVCVGNATQFTSTSTTNPSGQPITGYLWDFGDGQTSTQQNPTHTYANAGDYTVTLTAACGENICTNTKTKTVTVNALPVANAGPDSNVNFQNSATLTAAAVSGASYMWQPAEKINGNPAMQTVHTIPLTETTTFTLTVTKSGCSSTDDVTISVGDAMSASVTIAENEICEGNSTTVSAAATGGNGTYSYSWTSLRPIDFGNSNAASTTVRPLESGDYIISCAINDGQTTITKQVNLWVNPAENEVDTVSLCPSELPYILELPDGTTEIFNDSTVPNGWHTTVQNEFGCNVNVSLYLSIDAVVENTYYFETCDEPCTFIDNGVVIKVLENTCVFDTIYPFGECEKHAIVHFTRNSIYDENYDGEYVSDNYPEHHCNSYTWTNGQTYDRHGDFTWTFQSVHGCDSVVTLHLDERNLSFTVEGPQPTTTIDTCKNNEGYFMWGGELVGKRIYYGDTISGSLYDHTFAGASSQGCDSIGFIKIRLYSQPHVNSSLGGDELVEPGLGFMPYIYEYSVQDLYGAGVECDHPAEFIWEIFSYYDTPNRLYPEIEDNFESTWFISTDETNKNKALVYVNEEGNALLRCTIKTMCGTVYTEKFIYTEGWKVGFSVEEINYDNMINIFPNPSDGELYIGYSEFLSTTPLTISIYSYSGTLIDQFRSSGDSVTHHSTNSMANGLYFVRISGKDFVVTKKFVLNK